MVPGCNLEGNHMDIDKLHGRLEFLRQAEQLKSVLRSAHFVRAGREHRRHWRLCLMAMTFADELAGLDLLKVLRMCVIHDLGEAIHGDIPAVSKDAFPTRASRNAPT
jgi:putative hydrolase of HD superfamily